MRKSDFFVWLDQLPQNCWRLPLFLAETEENPSNSIEKKNTSHDSTPFFSNFIIYYRCNKVERVQSPALSSNGTVCLWGWETHSGRPAGKETRGGRGRKPEEETLAIPEVTARWRTFRLFPYLWILSGRLVIVIAVAMETYKLMSEFSKSWGIYIVNNKAQRNELSVLVILKNVTFSDSLSWALFPQMIFICICFDLLRES